ncbi:Ig-like domain-containing protein [Paenibacillus piscarius]|uniref:Ig-like domain-containing protein n=1 Tax=Paenibacillus piscarius TaxID=1089681 RepID=UPI001EE9879C|nr:Ig-like domain-containing protein [Paenibacillus piscarius]
MVKGKGLKRYFSLLLAVSLVWTGAFPVYAGSTDNGEASWVNVGPLPGSNKVNGVAVGSDILVAVGEAGSIVTASSPTTWTASNFGVEDLNSIIHKGAGGEFVAVGDNGIVLTSTNGVSWTPSDGSFGMNWNGVSYGDETLVLVGDSGMIMIKNDNDPDWKIVFSDAEENLNAVAYGNGKFVAVGDGGRVVTSVDGLEWKKVTSKTTNNLNGVAFGGGMFVAVGASGTIITSPDSSKGAAKVLESKVNLNGITFGNSVFMAAGDGGKVFSTTDLGQTWKPETTNTTAKLNGIVFNPGQNQFIAAGDSGEIIMSYVIPNIPRVLSLTPGNDETDVEVDMNLEIMFNQPVTAASADIDSDTDTDTDTGNNTNIDNNIKIFKAADLSAPVEIIPADDTSRVTLNPATNTVTINPGKNLNPGTKYAVTVDADAFTNGASGNAAIAAGEWSFTTVAGPGDTTAPTVSDYSPEPGATGVPIDAQLTLTFDEDVTPDSGNIVIYDSTDEGNLMVFPVNSPEVTVKDNVVTIVPFKDFNYSTTYYVNIDNGAFKDLADNPNYYTGISDKDTWRFTTEEAPDTTPPVASDFTPKNGATDVPIGTNLTLTFNEDVQKSAGEIKIYNSESSTLPFMVIPADSDGVTIDGKTVTINPKADLEYSATYYVQIDNSAFKDMSDNSYAGITNNTTWRFTTTSEPDTTAPIVSTYSPANGATNVAVDTNLELAFSENVQAGEGSIKIYSDASDRAVAIIAAGDAGIVNNKVTIHLAQPLEYGTSYVVRITDDAFADLSGNFYSGIANSTTWHFNTTAAPDTAPPLLDAFAPLNGTTDVATDANLTLTFSENVKAGAGNIVIYNSANHTPAVTIPSASGNVSILNNVVTINPTDDLKYGASYYVQIDAGAFTDAAGNSFAGITDSNAWQFTTTDAPDRTSPTVVTYSPEPWATEVEVNANLVLTFSENVKAAAGNIEIFRSTDVTHPVLTIPAGSDMVTILNNVVTINPADHLEHGTSYFVRVTEGAFTDNAGNSYAGIAGINAWRFVTTSASDTAAPVVTTFIPADKETFVPVSAALSLTFNENVRAGKGNIQLVNAADNEVVTTIEAVNQTLVTITNATVSINTSGLLKQGGSYYVLIQPGAFTDESGNSYAGITDKTLWSFSTVPVPVTPTDPPTPAPGGGGSGSGGGAPAPVPTPAPQTESINANVENGASQGSMVSSVVITRTKDANGVKSDTLTFTLEQAIRAVNELKAAGSNIARIIVPDQKDEVAGTRLTIPAASGKQFADNQITLDLFTVNAEVKVPGSSMAGFGTDIYFNLVPLKTSQQSAEAEALAKAQVQSVSPGATITLVSRPVTIETNLQSRPVTLVLPLNHSSLTAEQLKALAVFIEHSDGTKELVKGEIVPYGQTGKSGIQFSISKFSTFTVVLAQNPAVQVKAYMTGYADGTFKPGNSITRAEAASIIARTFSQSAVTAGVAYSDVLAGHWAAEAIGQVTRSGMMKGYTDGSFKPNQTITRAEMATLLSRLITSAEGQSAGFSDIAGHWAQADIKRMAQAGMITGYQDGTFRPNQTLTRAEAVTIINRALRIAPLTSAAPRWTDVPAGYWAFGSIQAASVDHTAE